jgi:photosystem II stability/assembly factor-like uncharacterized protein
MERLKAMTDRAVTDELLLVCRNEYNALTHHEEGIHAMIRMRRFTVVAGCAAALLLLSLSARTQVPGQTGDPRVLGFEKHQAMQQNSPSKSIRWQFLGPTNSSGRLADVDVAKTKGRTRAIYVAAGSGGLWKTENEGVTWVPVFEQGASTSIGDVAVASSRPDTVWIGTGEANILRGATAGAGVYKSTDAGKTWQHMGLAGSRTAGRIVIHPADANTVYVAASGNEWTESQDRGVYKTTDGGRSWNRILFVNAATGAIDLDMDPSDPNTLYAATWQRARKPWSDPRNEPGYSGSGIHKTTDGGRTWAPVNDGLPAAQFRGRIGLCVARSNPGVVYAFVDNYEIARKAGAEERDAYGRPKVDVIQGATVYRSSDKARTWQRVSAADKQMESVSSTYGWVFGQIRVDPNDADRVYLLGVQSWLSTDGGKSFFQIRKGGTGDNHALWIDPENSYSLIDGDDYGLGISYDRGATWRRFSAAYPAAGVANIPVAQYYNVAYDMGVPFKVYGSTQDSGSKRGAVDISSGRDRIPAVAWESAPGGEGSCHAVDPTNASIVYSAGFYGSLNRTDYSAAPAQPPGQAPGGRASRPPSKAIRPQPGPGEPPLRGQWIAPFILSPHDSNVIYFGAQYLYRSPNRGDTWQRISPDLTGNDPKKLGDIQYQTIVAISESPKRAGLLYVGTDDGRAHITRDGGKTWTDLTAKFPQRKWISRVVASAFDEGTVYLSQSGRTDDDYLPYMWKSSDYGQTWKNLASNIPTGPVNALREDPSNANVIYAGTDVGVYVSTDAGNTWSVLGDGLPSTFVFDMIVHPRDKILVAATYGRGMWALDVASFSK